MLRFTLAISAFATMLSAMASQPLRRTKMMTTEDGTTVSVVKRGGPDFSWWETADGQCYELRSAALGETTAKRVLMPIAKPDATVADKRMHKAMMASTENGLGQYGKSGMGTVASIGSPTFPVIMVAFSDLDFLEADNEGKVSRFLNEKGYGDEPNSVGSVADYFRLSSYGAFTPKFEVVGKVTLPQDHLYYGAHTKSANDAHATELIREAVRLAEEQGVDFSKYAVNGSTPLVSIIHAGPGEHEDYGDDAEDYMWAHFQNGSFTTTTSKFDSYLMTNETMRDFDRYGALTGERITGIGTFCHEFGHALGLPDMYDINHETGGEGETPGYWDVMDYQFMYNGYRPMEYSAYERSCMGWVRVADLYLDGTEETHRLVPVGNATESDNAVYRIVNPANDKEYFLLENRQESPFFVSAYLGHGLQVWHIDYDSHAWNSNSVNTLADRQRVHVVPADGEWQGPELISKKDVAGKRYTYPGDLFPGYTNCTTFDGNLATFQDGSFTGHVVDIAEDADGVITFRFVSNVDAISGPALTAAGSKAYDLCGRSVSTSSAHGVYIVGGKKMVK